MRSATGSALCSAHRAAAQYRHVKRLLEHYSVRYEDAKRERSALDFEDLELIARDLLRGRPEIQALWRERFLHVMVDEYQDTNALQDELLDLIAGERLFAVGDDRQSIYGFRHADVEGFRARRDVAVAAGRAARLDVNFRSAPAVLEAINVAFTDVWGDDYTPLRPGLEPDPGAAGRDADRRQEGLGRPRARRRPVRPVDARGDDLARGRGAAAGGADRVAGGGRRVAGLRRRRDADARGDRHAAVRARADRARHPDLRGRLARLLLAAADSRPARLPRGAGEPARRRRALLAAGVAAGGRVAGRADASAAASARGAARPVVGAGARLPRARHP